MYHDKHMNGGYDTVCPKIFCADSSATIGATITADVNWLIRDIKGPLEQPWDKITSLPDLKELFTREVGVSPDAKLQKVSSLKIKNPFPFPMSKTMTAARFWDIWELVKNKEYGDETKTVPHVEGGHSSFFSTGREKVNVPTNVKQRKDGREVAHGYELAADSL
jgi:hypothetical protein